MDKFNILHYKKGDSIYFFNGGKLIVTEKEYVIKNFFKTVMRFEINSTIITRVDDVPIYKGIKISDKTQTIHLYFGAKTINKLYDTLNIQK